MIFVHLYFHLCGIILSTGSEEHIGTSTSETGTTRVAGEADTIYFAPESKLHIFLML